MTSANVPLVLYAEDDENDVFFMERAFSRLKLRHALRVVLNGRQVVDYLAGKGIYADRASHPLPQVLLLDVKMPEMSGLEVLKWARSQPAFQSIPIVLFTSSTQRSDMEFSRTYGASGYLVKPSNAENLTTLVGKILAAYSGATVPGTLLAIDGNQLAGT